MVGSSITIMKKIVKNFGSGRGFKSVLLRKKKKSGALEKNVGNKKSFVKELSSYSWGSETGNTTKSDSIDIEKECLVEKTSFDYSENGIFADRNPNQTPKEGIKTKKALSKPLGKINFANYGNMDDVLSDGSLKLISPLKNLVNISVRKSFALDIGLDKVAGKSSQENFFRCKWFWGGLLLS
ncbi:hypothetical protein G9A89_012902 [Geosiphon pyriformis]|nr:hypothetical protein G9A89_012902 [Geosiphon pyriformis]